MTNNNFTIVRLILATLVVFGHFKTLPGNPSPGIHSYADFAVDAFFIVSGYLVYGSFDNLPKLKSFYIKRFFRIYPLYFIMILLQFIAMFILLGGAVEVASALKYLGANLVFANFLSPDMGGLLADANNPAINPSLWTLKIEAMFYVIVPLLWWLHQRIGFKLWPLIYIVATIFAAVALYYGKDTLSKQLPGSMRFFVVGIMLYILQRHCERSAAIQLLPQSDIGLPRRLRLLAMTNIKLNIVVALLLFVICTYRYYMPWLLPVYPLLVGALVYICVLRLPPVKLKYDLSYGVYLIHAPLIQIALVTGIFSDSNMFLYMLFAAVYALSLLAEKFIELPMIAKGKKLSKKYE